PPFQPEQKRQPDRADDDQIEPEHPVENGRPAHGPPETAPDGGQQRKGEKEVKTHRVKARIAGFNVSSIPRQSASGSRASSAWTTSVWKSAEISTLVVPGV